MSDAPPIIDESAPANDAVPAAAFGIRGQTQFGDIRRRLSWSPTFGHKPTHGGEENGGSGVGASRLGAEPISTTVGRSGSLPDDAGNRRLRKPDTVFAYPLANRHRNPDQCR